MKKIICFLAVLYVTATDAQNVSVALSDKFKLPEGGQAVKAGKFFYFMDVDNAGAQFAPVAKLSKTSHAIRLYKYDSGMKEIGDVKLESGKKAFGPFASHILNFQNRVLLFYFKYNEDTVKLFMSEVDSLLDLVNTKMIFAISQKDELLMLQYNPGLLSLFRVQSPDETKLLLAFANERDIYSCILDKGLNITSPKMLAAPGKKFSLEDIIVDNNGNKYFAYEVQRDKTLSKEIMMENHQGRDLSQPFDMGSQIYKAKHLNFGGSRDNSKVYVYADYHGSDMMEGIMISSVDGENQKINDPVLFPYTNELIEKLRALSFTSKSKGHYTVAETQFNLVENEAGAIALFGQPDFTTTKPPDMFDRRRISYSTFHTGPIIGAFIKGGQAEFVVIPRNDITPLRAQSTIITHKNSFICVYSDLEKNIEEEKGNKENHHGRMVFVANLYNSDGTLLSQKRLGPFPRESFNYHFPSMQKLAGGNYLVSVSETTAGMTRYRNHLIHWLNLSVE
jgi:hypothetical protein